MKKEYNTPSMIITSFSNEEVITTSAITTKDETQTNLGTLNVGSEQWF
jgi:hypothetical protein